MEKIRNGTPYERFEEVQRQRKTISNRPYWWVQFKEPDAQKEIELMKRHYEDMQGIIADSKKIRSDKLFTYRYQYKLGFYDERSYDERCYERWDEDWQSPQKYLTPRRPYESDVGLIQQVCEATHSQSRRTGENIRAFHCELAVMTPPCDLDIDIEGAGCRLLWGRSHLFHQTATEVHEFDVFMSGRELLIGYIFHPETGFEDIRVSLLRGKPLDHPCWGTLLKT